jgi:putative redox protein
MPSILISLTQPDFGLTASDKSGNTITMDTSHENGGRDFGIRPMQGLLMSLGGCSGIDVISILKKQRQHLKSLHIEISGEREQNKVPALWKYVHLHFIIGGDVSAEKASLAVRLSIENYCSVAETLRRAGCGITWEVSITGQKSKIAV